MVFADLRTAKVNCAVLDADVGELVLPTVDQAVARADDVGRPLVQVLDERVEAAVSKT